MQDLKYKNKRRAVQIAFLGHLIFRFKELLPLLEEHLIDHDDKILGHLLMADITRWIIGCEIRGDDQTVAEILQALEDELETAKEPLVDDPIFELIGASFLENLPNPNEPGASIRLKIGPKLKDHLRKIWPSDRTLD